MKRFRNSASLLVVLGLLVAACGSGEAEPDATTGGDGGETEAVDPATFYEDKAIRFVTSSSAGGGTDTKIRTLAIQLPRFIPGEPAARVSNVTPHVAGINFVWGAEPDGLTVGMTAAPTLEFEFFEESEWDSSEWQYIGSMDSACDNMLMVLGETGYTSIEDMIGADGPELVTITAAPTPADVEPVALSTMLIAEYLDLPLTVKRVADAGTSALNLGLERGEINFARYGADWCRMPDANPGWLEDGFVIPILDVATAGPDVDMASGVDERGERPPHVSEILTPEQYEEWRGLVAASRAGGNPIFMPPGTPDEVMAIMRDAFSAAIQDEDFVDAVETSFGGSSVRFYTAEEIAALTTENLGVLNEYNERYVEIVEELFAKYVE
jgi:hypothetical protein